VNVAKKMSLNMKSVTSLEVRALVKGEEELRRLGKNLNTLSGQAKKTRGAFNRLKNASSSLGGVMASLGATAAATGFVRAGIFAQRTSKTIAALATDYKETAQVTQFASDAAKRFGMGQTETARAVADLYARLRPMDISLKDIENTFIGVNQAGLRMNLTAADMDGVLLQLSQALGSGVLQGDEFRSVMERLPAVGQAVADELGIAISGLKEASGDGLLTTEVVIKAMDRLKKLKAPPPDSFKLFRQAQLDLATTIGNVFVPIITPLVKALTGLIKVFDMIPGPIKGLIIIFGGLVIAATALVVPIGIAVTAFSAIGTAIAGLKAAGLVAVISGWVGSMGPVVAAFAGVLAKIKAIGLIVAAVFTGPAAPFVLGAVAVGGLVAALLKFEGFRELFVNVGKWAWGMIKKIQPIADWVLNWQTKLVSKFLNYLKTNWSKVKGIVTKPFVDAFNFVKKGIQNAIKFVDDALFGWYRRAMKRVNSVLAKIGLAKKSSESGGSPKGYAEGGYIPQGGQLAIVGEGKSSEYIIPSHKMGGFINNYLSGLRGNAAIPRFAEGGFVSGGSPNINIKTGPVMQMSNGQQYVTVNDLQSALSSFSASVFSQSRTAGGRRFQGIS